MGYYILISLAIIAAVLLLFVIVKIRKNKKINRICTQISCDEGTFSARGDKKKFKIIKDERYVFEIVDGRIVSVKERHGLFYKKVIY